MKNLTIAVLGGYLMLVPGLLLAGSGFEMKFGKVDKELLLMKQYEADSTAEAVVIGDVGSAGFEYNVGEGDFDLIFERHIRIKILKKSGYGEADFSIPLYSNGIEKENLYGLKGYTFNLVDGKEEKVKLSREMMFREEASERWTLEKFTMPNVKVGSVIDLTYKIQLDFVINLWAWEFQRNIPVAYSEYTVNIPEYFNYMRVSQGYYPLYNIERGTTNGFIVAGGGRTSYSIFSEKYIAKKMPAIEYEDFISSPGDFVSKIEFQLATVDFPGSPTQNIMGDWQEIEKDLRESESFGNLLNKRGFFKEELEMIDLATENDRQKIAVIYEFVKRKMKWNQEKRLYVSQSLKKSFKEGTGNSADINLLLIAMLRDAGFDANPVILSTRDHGRIHPIYPILSKFNYVIARINIGDEYYLLDATDPFLPLGMLPLRCVSLKGREISDHSGSWIKIQENCPIRKTMVTANFSITEVADLAGNISISTNSYDAINHRKVIANEGEEGYMKEFGEDHQNWAISGYKFSNLDKLDDALVSDFEVAISAKAEIAGNLMFISPVLDDATLSNLFKQKERKLPIDFVTPFYDMYVLTIAIPEGYEIDELPEKKAFALPGKAGIFSYAVSNSEKEVKMNTMLRINKSYFEPQEYGQLKQFFDLIIAKQSEQIVLKKKS